MPENDAAWLADLASPDPERRVRALHGSCPCSGSSHRFELYMPLLRRMKKDPSPDVRKVALHLERDALELMQIEDERANGFRRNRPGGSGRSRELRRASVRQGR